MKKGNIRLFTIIFILVIFITVSGCFLFDNNYEVKSPVFYPEAGTYNTPITISIYCPTDGATIRFTTDGSTPSQNYGQIYTIPFEIYEPTVIKAMAYKEGKTDSPVVTAIYNITSSSSNPYDWIQAPILEEFAPDSTWTFMVYLDADNNLEDDGIEDFMEMLSGLYNLNNSFVKVIVLIDRGLHSSSTLIDGADWSDTRLYKINQDNTYTRLDGSSYGLPSNNGSLEMNMGDVNTLKNFINYCKNMQTSSHYALILWNHGGGARSKLSKSTLINTFEKAVCWDETDNDDCLYLDEVQQAISQYFNIGNKLDFIGFDACFMGTVEVAYEFKDLALVMAASMASEWGDGWDYDAIFKGMKQGSNNDPKELGKLIVKTYKESTIGTSDQTQVAVDLTNIQDLKTSIDNLAVAIYNENNKSTIETTRDLAYHFYYNDDESISYPYFDLNDLAIKIAQNSSLSDNLKNSANNIITNLSNTIIAAYAGAEFGYYYGLGTDVKRGLSIFFSRGNIVDSEQKSHYQYQWWYTSEDTNSWWPGGHYYGFIDFANSDNDGIVEYWRELLEAWHDPLDLYTPSSY